MKRIFLSAKISAFLMLVTFQPSFSQSIQDGLKALDKENYYTARNIFTNLVKANGADAMNWYYLGNTYCLLENNDSARWAFNKGIEVNPKSTACLIGMGKTYLNENKTADAMKYFDQAKALSNVNKDINISLYLADAYIYSVNYNVEEAIRILNQAENISNKNPQLYLQRGDAYSLSGKGGDAVNSYERAGELDPTSARPYSKIADIWYLAKNYQQSLANYQKAISIDATFAPAYRGMAELFYYTGQYDKAKETFAKYLELADKSDITQYRYAQFLFLSKDYGKAMNLVQELMKKDSSKLIMYRIAGYSNYEMGNYGEAKRDLEVLLNKMDAKRIIVSDYEYMGRTYKKTGNDSLWISYMEKAAQTDSSKAFSIYGELADSLYKMKDYGRASIYFEKKINKAPKQDIRDYFSLGRSYYFDSSFVKADSAFSQVLKLSPGWIQGYLYRARSNNAMENPDSMKGLAVPFYDSVILKGSADTVKYATELKEAYINLAQYYYNIGQTDVAVPYFEKYLTFNPKNAEEIKQLLESIKAQKKGTGTKPSPK